MSAHIQQKKCLWMIFDLFALTLLNIIQKKIWKVGFYLINEVNFFKGKTLRHNAYALVDTTMALFDDAFDDSFSDKLEVFISEL